MNKGVKTVFVIMFAVVVYNIYWMVVSYTGQIYTGEIKRQVNTSNVIAAQIEGGGTTLRYITTLKGEETDDRQKALSDWNIRFINEENRLRRNKTVIRVGDLPLSFGFQPDIDVEFPYEKRDAPRIPHILHQIWLTNDTKNASVPTEFSENVVNLIKHNPNWTYFFWTEESSRAFLSDIFPKLFELYSNTQEYVVRSDILRYAIMYHYGGVYVDVDTLCFRNLDIVTWKYPCIVVPIPFERSNIEHKRLYYFVNGEMICRPKHPLFRHILDFLESKTTRKFGGCSLGPFFITHHFHEYNNITGNVTEYPIDINRDNTSSPYIYKGKIPAHNDDGIYVPNSRYFITSHPGGFLTRARKRCNETNQTPLFERACEVLRLHKFQTLRTKHTFLDHTFAYSWGKHKMKQKRKYVSIKEIKPDFKIYSEANSIL